MDPSAQLVRARRLDESGALVGGYGECGGAVLDGADAVGGDPGSHFDEVC